MVNMDAYDQATIKGGEAGGGVGAERFGDEPSDLAIGSTRGLRTAPTGRYSLNRQIDESPDGVGPLGFEPRTYGL